MIKQLQFDYWPIHRSDDVKNPLIEEGSLQDLLSTYWNDVECWPTIELSKEQMDKGSIQRTADIEIKESNILNLINTQRWVQDEEQIELSALKSGKVDYFVADLNSEEGRENLVSCCPEADILINNNGGPPPENFLEIKKDQWLEALESNFLSAIMLVKALLPGMQERKF